MQVKQGVAYATLTDVKNLIGDVFSLVDKHGEVTVTSYNKPKYKITKAASIETVAEPALEVEAAHSAPVSAPISEPASDPIPELPPLSTPLSTPEHTVIPMPEVTAPAVVEEPKAISSAKALWSGLQDTQLWDRIHAREQAWVQKARNLI